MVGVFAGRSGFIRRLSKTFIYDDSGISGRACARCGYSSAANVSYRFTNQWITAIFFDEWLKWIGSDQSAEAAVQLFREVLVSYFEICFRLFRLGMMPEVHGQNCVLVWKQGKIEGLLLRDHDALRVHVPWLNANGLEDPAYTLRAGIRIRCITMSRKSC